MPHSHQSRRTYRDRPPRPSLAGHAFVLLLGVLLLLVSLAGGLFLSWRAGMVSVADIPLLNSDIKQACADVKRHNADYSQRVSTAFHQVVAEAAKGDQAASTKAIEDARDLMTAWIGALRAAASLTDNDTVQRSINDLATKLETVSSGKASLDDMYTMVNDTNRDMAAYCG